MAIRRKAYIDTLDQLLSDLPGLMLKAQASHEGNRIERERLKSQEDAAYAELMLNNLNLQLEVSKQSIESDRRAIDAIDKEFSNTTANMPTYQDLEYSGPEATAVLDNIEKLAKGPYKDQMIKRASMISEYSSDADAYNRERITKEKDVKVLRFLKANMLQNTSAIAGLGGDLEMIDASDFEPYWNQTMLPQLIEKGFIAKGESGKIESDRYKNVWMGMLAPETHRMEQSNIMKTYNVSQMKSFLEEKSLVEIEGVWDQLSFENKQDVIDATTKRIAVVLAPMRDAMGFSKVSSVIDLKIHLETLKSQDEWAAAGHGKSKWDAATQKAHDSYETQVTALGSMITGLLPSDITGYQVDSIYKTMAERTMKAYISASDKENPSEKLLMQVLAEIQDFQMYEHEVADSGILERVTDKNGNYVKRKVHAREKHFIMDMLGLKEFDYDAGIIEGMLELYDWKVSKEAESILEQFDSGNQDDSSMFVPNQYQGLNAIAGARYEGERADDSINQVLTDMLTEVDNDWII